MAALNNNFSGLIASVQVSTFHRTLDITTALYRNTNTSITGIIARIECKTACFGFDDRGILNRHITAVIGNSVILCLQITAVNNHVLQRQITIILHNHTNTGVFRGSNRTIFQNNLSIGLIVSIPFQMECLRLRSSRANSRTGTGISVTAKINGKILYASAIGCSLKCADTRTGSISQHSDCAAALNCRYSRGQSGKILVTNLSNCVAGIQFLHNPLCILDIAFG